MDISETTVARSDQQNYDNYLGGATRTVTITAVTGGNAEQPVNVELAEYPGRPFKPNKSMRRVLVLGWGKESSAYVGRQLKLFGNPAVVFGGKAVGGVEIAAMSHLDNPLVVPLTVTRGKRKNFTVNVLETPAAPDLTPILAAIHTAPTLADLQSAWASAGAAGVQGHPDVIAAKDARKVELGA